MPSQKEMPYKPTLLKYVIQGFFKSMFRLCNCHYYQIPKLLSPPKETLYPIAVTFYFPPVSGNHYFLSLKVCLLWKFHKIGIITIYYLMWVASFT
jgi:hypothetical protein